MPMVSKKKIRQTRFSKVTNLVKNAYVIYFPAGLCLFLIQTEICVNILSSCMMLVAPMKHSYLQLHQIIFLAMDAKLEAL